MFSTFISTTAICTSALVMRKISYVRSLSKTLFSVLGEREKYVPFYAVSESSTRAAEMFVPRPDDVIVCTYSKTGTTLVQQICQQLRSADGISDEEAMNFEEITEEIPWIDFAYDVGVDLKKDQRLSPRIFKSHQPLSSINRGCKYISTLRRPADTARSYYYFYLAKDHPSTRGKSLDEWTRHWAEHGTWVFPIFEHYVQFSNVVMFRRYLFSFTKTSLLIERKQFMKSPRTFSPTTIGISRRRSSRM